MSLFEKVLDKFQLNYDDEYDEDFENDEYDEEDDVKEGRAVSFLSKLFGEEDYDDDDEEEYVPKSKKVTEYHHNDTKEPKRETRKETKVKEFDESRGSGKSGRSWSVVGSKKISGSREIEIVVPDSFNDVRTITDYLLDNKVAVVNMEKLEVEDIQRTVDFLCGATFSIGGDFMPINGLIYVCAPSGNELIDEIKHEMYNTDMRQYDKAN